jgi:hypothetical protein
MKSRGSGLINTSLQRVAFGLARNWNRFSGFPQSVNPAEAVYLYSALVGMARCAVPARVAAGGTNIRATLEFEGVAPLHAARTSQRDVPTTLNTSEADLSSLKLSSPR